MLADHRWLSAADGWNCYSGHNIMMHSIGIGMECAHLLSGDPKYLDLLRSQMKLLMDNVWSAYDDVFPDEYFRELPALLERPGSLFPGEPPPGRTP